ncbi:hypothetical protein D9619_000392 [Psilocybe cf. subviscida]|uniref:Uncharacterized protein n=1 Tax=Psilocybe cf. subviscida TaxID=2480587 RepID=A0A8H5BCX7_9AGAR|nr:hypothetical protein D9619_000392 [Psilocybe cf. subviscida]
MSSPINSPAFPNLHKAYSDVHIVNYPRMGPGLPTLRQAWSLPGIGSSLLAAPRRPSTAHAHTLRTSLGLTHRSCSYFKHNKTDVHATTWRRIPYTRLPLHQHPASPSVNHYVYYSIIPASQETTHDRLCTPTVQPSSRTPPHAL